jgi:hypothetical protein
MAFFFDTMMNKPMQNSITLTIIKSFRPIML